MKKQTQYFANKGPSSQSYGFSSSHVWMWEIIKKAGEFMLLNCGAGEDSWEAFGQQRDKHQSILKEINLNIHWKDWHWNWSSNTLATWCKEPTHWKRPWCWERLRAGGEGGDRGWDGWMASPIQWTWVWENSGRWWRTGKPVCCSPEDCKGLDTIQWLNNNKVEKTLSLGCSSY